MTSSRPQVATLHLVCQYQWIRITKAGLKGWPLVRHPRKPVKLISVWKSLLCSRLEQRTSEKMQRFPPGSSVVVFYHAFIG